MQKLPKLFKPKFKYDLIRVGNKNDGGYLISFDTLSKSKCLLSFGVGLDLGFEIEFHHKINKPVYSYDKNHFKFYFKNEFLLSLNNFRRLSFTESLNVLKRYFKIRKYSKKVHFFKQNITYNSINKIINDLDINNELLIKIDIEGSEYRTLDCIVKNQDKITGLIIEFHDVDLHMEKIKNFINKINLDITHIHANNFGVADLDGNPTVIEITFEKNPKKMGEDFELPNKLDTKNNPLKKDFFDYLEK